MGKCPRTAARRGQSSRRSAHTGRGEAGADGSLGQGCGSVRRGPAGPPRTPRTCPEPQQRTEPAHGTESGRATDGERKVWGQECGWHTRQDCSQPTEGRALSSGSLLRSLRRGALTPSNRSVRRQNQIQFPVHLLRAAGSAQTSCGNGRCTELCPGVPEPPPGQRYLSAGWPSSPGTLQNRRFPEAGFGMVCCIT